jgi:hypothetical protein
MAALASVEAIKQYLDIRVDTDDALLYRLAEAETDWLTAALRMGGVTETQYDRRLNGSGSERLLLPEYPIIEVIDVLVEGEVIPLADDDGETGYWYSPGDCVLQLIGGYVFPRGVGNVNVVWTAGYKPVPSDLEQLCIELVGTKYVWRKRIGESSKSLGGETVAYVRELTEWQKEVLKAYRRVVPIV